MDNSNSQPHAALLASPGMGHLFPVLELSKRLATHHGFIVTLIIVPSPSESQTPHSDPNHHLNIIQLPHVDISGQVDPDATFVTKLAVMMRAARPSFRSTIYSMNNRPTVLIVDLFGTEVLGIGNEFDMKKYVYVPSNARFLAFTVYSPTLDEVVEGEFIDEKEPLRIPGSKPVRPEDVVDPMLDRTNQQYFEHIRIGAEIPTGDGILVNTWEDLEPTSLKALRDDQELSRIVNVPIYPIGPLVRTVEPEGRRIELLEWLDVQPAESVIYISFGSGGTLSVEQITELAWGLELSQQRFIWVVRPPVDDDASACFFSRGNGLVEPSDYLPEGFLDRSQGRGRVVPLWAPQVEILSHSSVGGFLSHCGWNSTLESITNGVPMIAWPLYAEQRLNATLLTEEIRVAVRPKELPTKKVVGREEIEEMLRKVMQIEGNAVRDRVKRVQQSAVKALSENGGSSYNSLCQLSRASKI